MMKSVLLVAILLVALVSAKSSEEIQFRNFQTKYNKIYSANEYAAKFTTFKSNLGRIASLNAHAKKVGASTVFAVNEFADLSAEEFRHFYLNGKEAKLTSNLPMAAPISDDIVEAIPSSFDWRTKGAVTPVKNQGQCGSCWSFSTTGNVEGQWFLSGNTLTGLSEQNLVDCDHHCMEYDGQQSCDAGCDGGLQPNAFQYIIDNGGLDTEASYPYLGIDNKCQFNPANIGAKISNWTMIPQNETQMAAYLAVHGPISIAADAETWQFYFGGVFDIGVLCGKTLDHGILIVGYGVEASEFGGQKPYWIVKNSWGAGWGEAGYLRIIRGTDECGLANFVSSSIIA